MVQIAQDVEVTPKAISKLLKHLRAHIAKLVLKSYIEDEPLGIVNEPGRVHPCVEMDETKIINWQGERLGGLSVFLIGGRKDSGFFIAQTTGNMKNLLPLKE
ncbi:unnamed protein product [Blepharisma stoltei]|uniref:Transposase n=1 Tax=Blepharisma stoltei TaxID=1481888 RepID=A0AAU9JVK4_9CILI|nr:unnamed protein product [Blepharisma stoltei]